MRAVIYARVSSKEQEETGYSLPSQERFLREYGVRKDFTIEKVFSISESASGKKQREEFLRMMSHLEKNKIKVLICEKVDRLTRNLKDAVLIDEWLEDDEERQVHLVKDSLILHQDSRSQEKLNWGIRIIFAKNYIDNLSEEVRKGHKEKIAQGWLPTKPPLGYKTIGNKGHKTHIQDEIVAPLIKEMFELYSTGNYSTGSLVHIMHKRGLRNREGQKVGKSRMYDFLSNPFYCGKIEWKGQTYPGKQEPLITEELFDSVQEKLNRKFSQPMHRKHLPLFKGKVFCGKCSATVTWETHKGHWYGHHSRYVKQGQKHPCNDTRWFRQEEITGKVLPLLQKAAPKNNRVLALLEKALKEDHLHEVTKSTENRRILNSEYERAQRRLEAIYEDKIDGKITSEFYEKKAKEYTAQREQIVKELKRLNEDNTKYYEVGYAIHELALKATDILLNNKADISDKRLLLSYAFSNISLIKGEIKPEYTTAFDFLVNWMPRVNSIFEPTIDEANKEKEATFVTSHPVMLRR